MCHFRFEITNTTLSSVSGRGQNHAALDEMASLRGLGEHGLDFSAELTVSTSFVTRSKGNSCNHSNIANTILHTTCYSMSE